MWGRKWPYVLGNIAVEDSSLYCEQDEQCVHSAALAVRDAGGCDRGDRSSHNRPQARHRETFSRAFLPVFTSRQVTISVHFLYFTCCFYLTNSVFFCEFWVYCPNYYMLTKFAKTCILGQTYKKKKIFLKSLKTNSFFTDTD